MRIESIEVRDFGGFPAAFPCRFDPNGKNLLLFGENGSGKSSLCRALRELFTVGRSARPFSKFRHRFTPARTRPAALRSTSTTGSC